MATACSRVSSGVTMSYTSPLLRRREVGLVDDVPPAQLQGVDPDLMGNGVDHLLAGDGLHRPGPRNAALPQVLV